MGTIIILSSDLNNMLWIISDQQCQFVKVWLNWLKSLIDCKFSIPKYLYKNAFFILSSITYPNIYLYWANDA